MKAVIVTSQRTGSTFLARCLDSHPQIRCYLEILVKSDRHYSPEVRRHPIQFLDSFYARNEAPVMVFKTMYNQLIIDFRLLWYFIKNTDIRVIHLQRDNLLKQHVSNMLNKQAHYLGRPPHTNRPVPEASVYINPQQAIFRMQMTQWISKLFSYLLRNHLSIELVYEDMIDGHSLSSGASKKIMCLLDIDYVPMYSDLVKMNPDNLEAIIQNYDQVVRVLRGTKFGRYLDEEGERKNDNQS